MQVNQIPGCQAEIPQKTTRNSSVCFLLPRSVVRSFLAHDLRRVLSPSLGKIGNRIGFTWVLSPSKRCFGIGFIVAINSITPRKINIEPENTPLEEENHLPNLHFPGSMLIFGGVHAETLSTNGRKLVSAESGPLFPEQRPGGTPWVNQWKFTEEFVSFAGPRASFSASSFRRWSALLGRFFQVNPDEFFDEESSTDFFFWGGSGVNFSSKCLAVF